LRRGSDDADRIGDSLEMNPSPIDVADARKPAGEVTGSLGDENLAAVRKGTQPCRHVEGGAAERTVLESDCLARVDTDPDVEGKIRVCVRLARELPLEIHSGSDRLPRRVEHRQRLVAADLDQRPAPKVSSLPHELAELRGQPGGRLVAVF